MKVFVWLVIIAILGFVIYAATMPPTTDTVAATVTSSPLPSEPITVEKPAVAAGLPTEPPAFGWKWGFASGKNGFTYGYGYGPSQGSVNFWNIGG